MFRVLDAYKIALSLSDISSSSSGPDPIWRSFWSLKIPPKARIFLWRAVCDILPHGAKLRTKGIANVGTCIRCGEVEDNFHVLRNCSWAKQFWQMIPNLPMWNHLCSFKEWLAAVMELKASVGLDIFGMCAWQI